MRLPNIALPVRAGPAAVRNPFLNFPAVSPGFALEWGAHLRRRHSRRVTTSVTCSYPLKPMQTQPAQKTAADSTGNKEDKRSQPLTLAALAAGDYSAADFMKAPFGSVTGVLREFYDRDTTLAKEVKEAKTARDALPIRTLGKVLAVLNIRYEQDYAKGDTSKTFAGYWKETQGSEMPVRGNAGRVSSVARVFRCVVLDHEQLAESDFDKCAGSWFDDASAILPLLPRLEGGRINWGANDTLDFLNLLRMKRGADGVPSGLRKLKARLQGKVTVSAGGKEAVLDLPNVVVLLQRTLSQEFNGAAGVGYVLSELTGYLSKEGKNLPDERARSVFFALKGALDEFAGARGDDIARWTAPVQTVNTPAPAGWDKVETANEASTEPDWDQFTKAYLALETTPAETRNLTFEEVLEQCRDAAFGYYRTENRWITPAELDPLMNETPDDTEARLKRLGIVSAAA